MSGRKGTRKAAAEPPAKSPAQLGHESTMRARDQSAQLPASNVAHGYGQGFPVQQPQHHAEDAAGRQREQFAVGRQMQDQINEQDRQCRLSTYQYPARDGQSPPSGGFSSGSPAYVNSSQGFARSPEAFRPQEFSIQPSQPTHGYFHLPQPVQQQTQQRASFARPNAQYLNSSASSPPDPFVGSPQQPRPRPTPTPSQVPNCLTGGAFSSTSTAPAALQEQTGRPFGPDTRTAAQNQQPSQARQGLFSGQTGLQRREPVNAPELRQPHRPQGLSNKVGEQMGTQATIGGQARHAGAAFSTQQPQSNSQQQAPQAPPQVPPLDINRRHFQGSGVARAYLDQPMWRPASRDHGVPTTEAERLPYVKRIYDAIVDLRSVWDLGDWDTDARRFIAATNAGGGLWGSHPTDIEAIAHEVVFTCIDLHNRGATGLPMRRILAFMEHNQCDWNFTFAQRIYFMSLLLKHFKFHANQVMQSNMTSWYLARIYSTLLDQEQFQKWWGALPKETRALHLGRYPYDGMPAKAPMDAEKAQLEREHDQEKRDRDQQALQRQTQQLSQQQQRAQQALQPQTLQRQPQQVQAAQALKRSATALDSPELGPSRKRRNPLASPDQGAVLEQPQPRRVSREVQAGGLLDFRSPSADGAAEEAFAERHPAPGLTIGEPPTFDGIMAMINQGSAQQPQQEIVEDEAEDLQRKSPSLPLPPSRDEDQGSLFNWEPDSENDGGSDFDRGLGVGAEIEAEMKEEDAE